MVMGWVKKIAWLFVVGSVVVAVFGGLPKDVDAWYPWLSIQSAKAKVWISGEVEKAHLERLPTPKSILPTAPPSGSSSAS